MMMAGSIHPPFSFRSCRKENGPWTVQKKRTLAQTCTYVQVCLNTGVVRIGTDQMKSPSAGRDPLRQSRFSASAADNLAETSGRFLIPSPSGPAAAPPALGEPPDSLRSRTAMGPARGMSNEVHSTRREYPTTPARQRSVPGPGRTPSPAIARIAAARLEAGSIRALPGPEDSPRAVRFHRTEGR